MASEWVDRGEVLPWAGDGDREWNDRLRACWYGVDGREFDWCEVNGGRAAVSGTSECCTLDCDLHAIVEGCADASEATSR